ncbi:MAG: CapA family protein, partial [Muribaculaceae bacterium]|nr:CapA family protein [Muribaculaceae bacterium]
MTSAFIILISFLSMILGIDEAEIVFAGDAMMHQAQIDAARLTDRTYDFSEYFEEIQPYVESADYAVVNLETPVSKPPYTGYPCFNAPDSYIDALSNAGFDLFLTANNHTLDRRDKGLLNTIDALDARKLDQIGTYKNSEARNAALPFIKNINGIKVGFINYTYGTNGIAPGADIRVDYIDRALIKDDIVRTRKSGAEIIIACIHWGVEYQLLPHESQKSLASYLRELGVEVIIGGHPHVVQPMELEPGEQPSLLVYSLGN